MVETTDKIKELQGWAAYLSSALNDSGLLQSEELPADEHKGRGEVAISLSQMVEYCKTRVSWEDARPIVAMLNVMLRGCGSQEEFELVDSIEREFIRRAGVGIQVKSAEIEVTSPGNVIANSYTRN